MGGSIRKQKQRSASPKKKKGSSSHKKQKTATMTTTTRWMTRSATAAEAEAAAIHFQKHNIMSKIMPETLYHITTFLDEVALCCLEEAFPLQINKPTVSHKRWEDMLQIQQQAYSSKDIGEDLVRMLQGGKNSYSGDLTNVVPRWPTRYTKHMSSMSRGRKFAKEILYAKEQLQSLQELTLQERNEYCRRGGLFECRYERRESFCCSGEDAEILITIVTHDGHHFATSMFESCKMLWREARRDGTTSLPILSISVPKSPDSSYPRSEKWFQVTFEPPRRRQQQPPASSATTTNFAGKTKKYHPNNDYHHYRDDFGKFYYYPESRTWRAFYPEDEMVRILYSGNKYKKDDKNVLFNHRYERSYTHFTDLVTLCQYRPATPAEIYNWKLRLDRKAPYAFAI